MMGGCRGSEGKRLWAYAISWIHIICYAALAAVAAIEYKTVIGDNTIDWKGRSWRVTGPELFMGIHASRTALLCTIVYFSLGLTLSFGLLAGIWKRSMCLISLWILYTGFIIFLTLTRIIIVILEMGDQGLGLMDAFVYSLIPIAMEGYSLRKIISYAKELKLELDSWNPNCQGSMLL